MTGAAAGVVAGPPGIFAGAVAGGSLGSAAAAQLGWRWRDLMETRRKGGAFTGAAGGAFGVSGVTRAAGQAGSKFSINTSITTGTSLVGNPNPRQYLNGTVSVNLPTLPTSKQGVTGGHEIDDKNSDKKKKIPRRVVTQRQHQVAHELRQYCIWLKTQYPMKCFLDVYMNASNFFEQFIITNADWELLANECVIATYTELDGKRIGENGAQRRMSG
ncbi:hypothetical protein F5051DRAFT_455721 [Lentinula edodes]|nr:hypothetical protein F5051DRAFT_455721 [Lentinula edodes]